MDLVGNIKNIGGKLQERKPAEGKLKSRKPIPHPRPEQKDTEPQVNESRVGLMLDVNA